MRRQDILKHQAKETARAYQAAHEGMELATKADIDYKIETLRKEIETVRKEIAELKNQLIMWLGGMLTVAVSVIVWFIEKNHI